MERFHQLLFIVSLVALSWFAMMAVHELGHVVGAVVTGGNVERVVLHPLTISPLTFRRIPIQPLSFGLAQSLAVCYRLSLGC
jgi:hypothetical protein